MVPICPVPKYPVTPGLKKPGKDSQTGFLKSPILLKEKKLQLLDNCILKSDISP